MSEKSYVSCNFLSFHLHIVIFKCCLFPNNQWNGHIWVPFVYALVYCMFPSTNTLFYKTQTRPKEFGKKNRKKLILLIFFTVGAMLQIDDWHGLNEPNLNPTPRRKFKNIRCCLLIKKFEKPLPYWLGSGPIFKNLSFGAFKKIQYVFWHSKTAFAQVLPGLDVEKGLIMAQIIISEKKIVQHASVCENAGVL